MDTLSQSGEVAGCLGAKIFSFCCTKTVEESPEVGAHSLLSMSLLHYRLEVHCLETTCRENKTILGSLALTRDIHNHYVCNVFSSSNAARRTARTQNFRSTAEDEENVGKKRGSERLEIDVLLIRPNSFSEV